GERVFGRGLRNYALQLGGVRHHPVGGARGYQLHDRLGEVARLERNEDSAGTQQPGSSHIFCRRSAITSAGRRMTPIPAASNAAIFSSAVPDEPEMIAPAWPMRRPFGAV